MCFHRNRKNGFGIEYILMYLHNEAGLSHAQVCRDSFAPAPLSYCIHHGEMQGVKQTALHRDATGVVFLNNIQFKAEEGRI